MPDEQHQLHVRGTRIWREGGGERIEHISLNAKLHSDYNNGVCALPSSCSSLELAFSPIAVRNLREEGRKGLSVLCIPQIAIPKSKKITTNTYQHTLQLFHG